MRFALLSDCFASRSCSAALLTRAGCAAPRTGTVVAVDAVLVPGVREGATATTAFLVHDAHRRRMQLAAGARGLRAGVIVALTAAEAAAMGLPPSVLGSMAASLAHCRHFGAAFRIAADVAPHGIASLAATALTDADVAWAPLAAGDGVDSELLPHAFEAALALRSGGSRLRLRAAADLPAGTRFALAHPTQAAAMFCHPAAVSGSGGEAAPACGYSVGIATAATAAEVSSRLGASLVVHLALLRAVLEGEELRCDAAAMRAALDAARGGSGDGA